VTLWTALAVGGGAILVGVSLGLLGSGGAILTVPILVYLVGHDEKLAIVESLAIVGIIAGVGAVRAGFNRRIDWPSVLLLALPGALGAVGGSSLARLVSGSVQLIALAALMVIAAALMFRSTMARRPVTVGEGLDLAELAPLAPLAAPAELKPEAPSTPPPVTRSATSQLILGLLQGVLLGAVTGFVGIGGGFLLIPVLTLLRGIAMPMAVGTSLAIITLNAAIGFGASAVWASSASEPNAPAINIGVVAAFAALGLAGSLVGEWIGDRLSQRVLRRSFAVLLLLLGCFVIAQRLWALGGV
jgi:uncharacterized membrane protein YfcA